LRFLEKSAAKTQPFEKRLDQNLEHVSAKHVSAKHIIIKLYYKMKGTFRKRHTIRKGKRMLKRRSMTKRRSITGGNPEILFALQDSNSGIKY